MENRETIQESPYIAALHILRGLLDKRRLGSTPEQRVVSVLEFCMTSDVESDDEIATLGPYIPQGQQLLEWYKENFPVIDRLRREDKREYFTDRWDLEDAVKDHLKSRWLANISEAVRMLPLDQEVANADIAMKLLYVQAQDSFIHAPNPPQAPLSAA